MKIKLVTALRLIRSFGPGLNTLNILIVTAQMLQRLRERVETNAVGPNRLYPTHDNICNPRDKTIYGDKR